MSRASDYVFRFDGAIPARHFGDDFQLSGWLVHPGGSAVNGIRVVVQRRLGRERIWKARRKRTRQDAAAAFPDLPAARTSGFFFEFHLSLGNNRLRFEALNADRVWQTFHTAMVRAFPLKSVGRAGFPRVRKWALGSLRRTYPEANILRQRQPRPAPAGASAISRVELFATTKSNLFIREIGELLAAGFTEVGCAAQLHLDEPPLSNPPDDTLQIIVTPHEFFNLYLSEKFSQAEARARAGGAALLCTEQPDTHWFQSNLQWAPYARAFADINPLGVLAYCARDARCHHFALGYHPLLRSSAAANPTDVRATEITFLGSLTPRREEFFGTNAAFFSARSAHLRFVPLDFAKTETTRSYLSAQRRNDLLADTRILLNVHYSAQRYFEWHRMLVGLANSCCVITETCEGYGALVPGEHFVMVEPENLVAACEYYLARPNECARIAQQGFEFVEKQLRQGQLCGAFLRDLATPGCEVPPDAAPLPLPRDLRRKLVQQNRRAFRHALAADVRDFWHPPAPPEPEPPLPSEEELAARRTAAIEKRAAYRARFVEQEKHRAAGTSVWELHDNEAYRRADLPVVSVVITLFNYVEFIRECVTSVERAAAHFGKPIEILIVDDASTDGSLAAARSCQEMVAVPFRIVAKQFNTGLADARNVGLGLARAEFVLMMDADNLILPSALADWHAAISTDERAAAYSLLARFEESPEKPFGLLSPFDWDPQILVQQPYIDAMAFFRRDVLLELGGYDNELNQIGWFGWEDYDLWLRIAAHDLKVGFVPNILGLYRQHSVSMLSVTNLFEQDLVAQFYERFGQLCARFEPHETLFGVARRKLRKGKSSVFIASGCPIATTTLYRCEHLREQFERLGHEAQLAEWFSEAAIDPEVALTYDLIVLYRLPMGEALKRLIDRAHELGKRVLFDTDDLVFEPDLIEWHRGVQLLSETDQQLHREGVERYLETLLACDAVMTATPLLAELAAARGKTAYVHRNALGHEMTRLADELYEARQERPVPAKVVVGYGSGTATHDVDFAEAATGLARVLVHHDKVELWIAGPLELPDILGEFTNKIQRFPLTDWQDWFRLMSRMDIALAPLERGNVFCRAKSEIKFVEAGALGIPVVASRIDPFQFAIEDGVTGFLAESEEEWFRALCLLVDEPERRREVGEAARQRVTESYSPEARAAELQSVLAQVESAKLKLNWLIPEPFPAAGGDTGIFRIIRDLAEFGHDCEVYVVAYNLMNDFSSEQVRSYVREHFGESPAHYQRWEGTVRDADATFATFWPTAENLLALPNGGSRYYLVQDFEPSFYPDDPKHSERAERTYRTGMHCITLGPWLAKLLRERYGAKAEYFDFAVDTKTYWPRPGLKSQAKRICFYARPATRRRAYEMGMQVFERIHEEFPEVEIAFFGADELTPAPTFPFLNRGKLPQEELAQLFSSSDIGVVFSLSNPSFVPLEMMACGCAVLEIASERWDGILTHNENAWLVEPTAEAVVGGLRNLLTDESLRAELVANGLALTREMSWRNSARQIERILLRDLA